MLTNGRNRATRRASNGVPQMHQHSYKMVLLGAAGVGKSSLVFRLVKDQFTGREPNTVGAAFLKHTVCLDNQIVMLDIWDTAGQERYHCLAPIYYRGAQAALVVYDVTCQDTFGRAKSWVKELRQASSSNVIALAGNKSDVIAKRMVEFEDAQAYADENGLIFMETSAKTAMNVNDIFRAIGQQLANTEDIDRELVENGRRRLASGKSEIRWKACCK